MPTPMDAMLGLVVTAIGVLTVVVAFLITEAQKRVLSYVLAGIVTASGLFYFVSAEIRGFQMRSRIANIQRQQQINLDEIQKRLKETQAPPAATPKR